jgi:hypothetical protein
MKKPKQLKSMQDLTDDLVRNYEMVKAGQMEIAEARALLDTADKVIQGVRTQMAYNAMMQNNSPIRFMDEGKELPASAAGLIKATKKKGK